jgi:hypothetical protein
VDTLCVYKKFDEWTISVYNDQGIQISFLANWKLKQSKQNDVMN